MNEADFQLGLGTQPRVSPRRLLEGHSWKAEGQDTSTLKIRSPVKRFLTAQTSRSSGLFPLLFVNCLFLYVSECIIVLTLSSIPEIPSSAWSCLLVILSGVVFISLTVSFISQTSVWFFFSVSISLLNISSLFSSLVACSL